MSGSVSSAAVTGRRITEVDILRGFALFGILVTNVIVMTTLVTLGAPDHGSGPYFDGPLDQVTTALVDGLFLGRFYLLFAFLFGYSFTLQIAAAERAGVSPRARLLRRCGALFLIGLAHVMLLWFGDILTLYAGMCLILILLRKLRPRTALIVGAVLYGVFALLSFLPPGNDGVESLGQIFDLRRLYDGYTGGFADTFHTQVSGAPMWMLFIWIGQGVPSLAMFLVGMAAGKRRVLADGAWLRRWAPRLMWVGFGVGVPVSAVTFADSAGYLDMPGFWFGMQELANPWMTFAYMAVIVRLTWSRWAGAVGRLAPAGRMAASNYIGQSVVFMLVYTGYGLGLADDLAPPLIVVIALVTFAAQLWVSDRWLRTHAYGPVEWVLRAATYRARPRWRRDPARST
ncbi:DUF418 domain-containing protein [Nocardia transvalensis]|uniref:DUF418 domain-containing protein n=1 Tax=Nocardia transvalensis TaxID=37333 RepID=UPI00189347FF|nr:DUF418 domain-containing protein [Nocardia transvalensis]MBF6328109.1 DUF418 domain-containing protein [Nocardia transvalensis]